MRKNFWWGVLFFLASSSPSLAGYEVRDPGHLLDQLDEYLGQRALDQSFKVGDVGTYTRLSKDCYLSCGPDGCASVCSGVEEAMSRTVTQADGNGATIELDDGTTALWTAEQFAALRGNAVRYDLALLDFQYPGYLETSQLRDRTYTTPAGQAIAGKEIVLAFHPQDHDMSTFLVRYTVSRDQPVVGQILQMAAFGSWFYKLTDVKRPLAER